jgi:hypothetical protein
VKAYPPESSVVVVMVSVPDSLTVTSAIMGVTCPEITQYSVATKFVPGASASTSVTSTLAGENEYPPSKGVTV